MDGPGDPPRQHECPEVTQKVDERGAENEKTQGKGSLGFWLQDQREQVGKDASKQDASKQALLVRKHTHQRSIHCKDECKGAQRKPKTLEEEQDETYQDACLQ